MADEKKLTFGDGFWFGLGFFTAGVVFYIIVLVITLLIFGAMMGSMAHHW
ncbi:hypothetical protein [Thermococcus sp. M39]|nr:hypothetical protein [Thermococcus sp. M39]